MTAHQKAIIRDARDYVSRNPSATFDDMVRDWRAEGRRIVDSGMLADFLRAGSVRFAQTDSGVNPK